jgi:hypothetical protein
MDIPNPHAEQYRSLRDEALKLVDETRKLEIYAVTAVAVLYAWLVKDGTVLPRNAFYIAPALVVLAAIRQYALYKRIEQIAQYLCMIEEEFFTAPKSLPGWERHLKDDIESWLKFSILQSIPASAWPQVRKLVSGVAPTAALFWLFFFVATLIAPSILRGVPAQPTYFPAASPS